MIKIAGMVILVISGVLVGLEASEKYSNRVTFLRLYTDLLMHLKTEIKYSQKSLFEILKIHRTCKPLQKRINVCISRSKEITFEKCWENAFENLSHETGVTKEEEIIIKEFGKNLGLSDIAGQINYIEHHLELIKLHLSSAINDKNSKGKLPIVLGTCLSLSVVLILI